MYAQFKRDPEDKSPFSIQYAPGILIELGKPYISESRIGLFEPYLRIHEDITKGYLDLEVFNAMKQDQFSFSTIPREPELNHTAGSLLLLEIDEIRQIGYTFRIFAPFLKDRLIREVIDKQSAYIARLEQKNAGSVPVPDMAAPVHVPDPDMAAAIASSHSEGVGVTPVMAPDSTQETAAIPAPDLFKAESKEPKVEDKAFGL